MTVLDFIVVALPRSGTTWAANWLTTDQVHCVHDPLYTVHYSDWDEQLPARAPGRPVGVSCTGAWRWTDWLNAHPARKLVLHRDVGEVIESMRAIGLPPVSPGDAAALDRIIGLHLPFEDLFDPIGARAAWEYLVPSVPFNEARHRELVDIEMQPKFSGLTIDPKVTRRLMSELERIAGGW